MSPMVSLEIYYLPIEGQVTFFMHLHIAIYKTSAISMYETVYVNIQKSSVSMLQLWSITVVQCAYTYSLFITVLVYCVISATASQI